MGLFFSKNFDSIECLYVDQLRDLYDAEQRLCKAAPKAAEAAGSAELKQAFQSQETECRSRIDRLEQSFKLLNAEVKAETCEAMKGLISELEEVADAKGDEDAKDAALIATMQRLHHYGMAGFGSVRAFARRLGQSQAGGLMQVSLDEHMAADEALSRIAERSVNVAAPATP